MELGLEVIPNQGKNFELLRREPRPTEAMDDEKLEADGITRL